MKYYIVINKRNKEVATKRSIEQLNEEIQHGVDQIVKIEIVGKTLYIHTKNYQD
jgi:hypothetical protein